MSDSSERGADPVEDAAADTPTLEGVLGRQRIEHADQARTSTVQPATPHGAAATVVAGGEVVDEAADGSLEIEGPNSA
jgi:hypothetical protein